MRSIAASPTWSSTPARRACSLWGATSSSAWRSYGNARRSPRRALLPDSHRRRAARAPEPVPAASRRGGARVVHVSVPDGEQAKSWQVLERVFDALLAARCGRDTLLVALGGGVVGDLAGFAAAVCQRGIAFLQVPTTLLAQVDSSVG